jgi:hypothetical protein
MAMKRCFPTLLSPREDQESPPKKAAIMRIADVSSISPESWAQSLKVNSSVGILILIRRIRMFLKLPEPQPDSLVTSKDPALDPAPARDPSIIKQNSKKILDFFCFLTS